MSKKGKKWKKIHFIKQQQYLLYKTKHAFITKKKQRKRNTYIMYLATSIFKFFHCAKEYRKFYRTK